MIRVLLAAGLVAAVLSAPAAAQSVTDHAGVFGGREVAYRAYVEETAFRDDDGALSGTMVTTSYVETGGDADRPVLFIFNGGPGASTTPLHFGAFGPYARHGEGADEVLAANPHSLLDTADLVFIDPVGTGYSRPEGDGAPFWSRSGDVETVAEMIRRWLDRHGRTDSPRYLLGQSYGTVRAAEIVARERDLDFDGVMLFALVPGDRSGPIALMTALPSYAAAAFHHGRVEADGRTVDEVYQDAVRFARTDYLAALVQGASLPEGDRREMAGRLAATTGLPVALIEDADLRIDNRLFMLNLLKDETLRTGQLDARATRSLDAPAQQPPRDDPGLGYVPRGQPAPDPADVLLRRGEAESIADAYFSQALNYVSESPYNALNLDVNAAWDHEGFADALPGLAAVMDEEPGLRVFWAAGYFDFSTPAYAGRYTLDQAGIPADRLTEAYFASGHSVFVDQDNLADLAGRARAFLAPDAR